MLKALIEFFSLIPTKQRKKFYILQALVVFMAFAEIIGIASIVPLMALAGDPSILEKENLLAMLYLKSNIGEPYDFILYLGFIILAIILTTSCFSMYVTWLLAMFATRVGVEIGDRLYSYYLSQDWLFHTMGSSSDMIKNITSETTRITNDILLPLIYLNARVILAFFIILVMFIYDPVVLTVGFSIFVFSYIALFRIFRKKIEKNSANISDMFLERFKLMNEGFGGIKEILLLGRSNDLKKRFINSGKKLAQSEGFIKATAAMPRYFLEMLAFSSIIALVLYLIVDAQTNLGILLPILSVYALAGMKLLPALQQIYFNVVTIKGGLSAYESIREDLKSINTFNLQKDESNYQVWSKHNEIILKDITFNYPGKTTAALEDISLTIKPNTIVGFVGTSGSGKSTLIDVIIGLIKPQKGEVTIDGTPLIDQNLKVWQKKIGFVPQAIFLKEGSVAENVTFGIAHDLINYEQVKKALKLANLEEWVSKLKNGVHTKVGERGVQLSGGQRQRLGIARALYYEADVLVFDEGTSALDGISEKKIMDAIHGFSSQKTLIMIAHRLQTVKKCDKIFMLENGRVVDSGTYQQLLEKNEQFKKMSFHS
jgi:ABC-type multidrug transport system fused ATPase/permease subunit